VIGNRILMPVKWNLLIRSSGDWLPHFQAIRLYTIACFLGLVFAVTGFFFLADMLHDGEIQITAIASALIILSTALFTALYLSFSPPLLNIVATLAIRLHDMRLGKLAQGADSFVRAYPAYSEKKGVVILFCVLTALELTLVIVRSYVVALSLGIDLPILVYFAFLPLATILNRMPISFDGFGVNGVFFIYFLGLFGVIQESAFLIGLINHLLSIVAILPGGFFYIFADRD
jgi:glycosyltransferase 2 family protein